MKPISPLIHGFLDYATAATFLALPRLLGWDKRATGVMTAAGAFATGYAVFTRYPLGVIKLLPMSAHLALDGLFDASVLTAAALLKDEDARVRSTLVGMAAMGSTVALLTRTGTDPATDHAPAHR
jgi:hypothetical protein